MRISYPHVYRDEGGPLDNEKSGHMLSAAFVRFLLSTASDYFTFWDGETRIELSNDERQIIEAGIQDLSMSEQLTKLVFTGRYEGGGYFPFNQTEYVQLANDEDGDASYAVWIGASKKLVFLKSGLVSVRFNHRMSGVTNLPFDVVIAVRINSIVQAVSHQKADTAGDSSSLGFWANVEAGDELNLTVYHTCTGTFELSAALTKLWVVYHG